MIGITHKSRLEQIENNLESIYDEIRNGYFEEESIQTAVYCQVGINRIVFKLNQLVGGTDECMWCGAWIPCSERLPEAPSFCLVTTDGSYNDVIDIALYMSDGWHKASKVLAWMPLPEPYGADMRGGDSE